VKPKRQQRGNRSRLGALDQLYIGLLLIVFGGIVLQAPISVIFGVTFPDLSLVIKAWKEILMLAAAVILAIILLRRHKVGILRDPLLITVGIYTALHLLLLPFFWQGALASISGFMIDLRYLAFFVLAYCALKLHPEWKRAFVKVGIIGALVVTVFGVLQVTVLPADALKYIGYSKTTIAPYLTVDQNPDYVRINSTLRGPNPLGAYATIVIAGVAAFLVRKKLGKDTKVQVITAILAAASLVCLWVSYSRSALAAAVVALLIVAVAAFGRKLSRKLWVAVCVVVIVLAGALVAARGTTFVSNVLLHESMDTGGDISSNEGHVSSVEESLRAVATHPAGEGVGSTGSASLFTHSPTIIENQYLFVAHEVGWAGLILFVLIWLGVLTRLWHERRNWLSLGVFASGVGLALIGLLLPVWVDDTVSVVWWGLAAIALVGGSQDD
jgi:hypothetical protein